MSKICQKKNLINLRGFVTSSFKRPSPLFPWSNRWPLSIADIYFFLSNLPDLKTKNVCATSHDDYLYPSVFSSWSSEQNIYNCLEESFPWTYQWLSMTKPTSSSTLSCVVNQNLDTICKWVLLHQFYNLLLYTETRNFSNSSSKHRSIVIFSLYKILNSNINIFHSFASSFFVTLMKR